jgi:hypothetical protein
MEQRIVALALAAMALLQTVLVALHQPGWPCPFRAATGLPCPGCGLSRAMVALLRGDWRTALAFHAFAPLGALCAVIIVAGALAPGRLRARLAARVGAFEERTGLAVWLAVAFLMYWLARLLYYPLTFAPPG